MRKLLLSALVLAGALFLAPAARAQFVGISGTVLDPNGIPYTGTISAVLTPGSSSGFTLSGQPYAGRIGPASLDSSGSFTLNFAANSSITPAGTQWLITVTSNPGGIPGPLGTGAQAFNITITLNTSQSISAQLSAAAPKLSNLIGGSGTVTACGTAATPDIAIFSSPLVICGTAALTSTAPGEIDQTIVGLGTFRTLSSTGNPTFTGGEGLQPLGQFDTEWSIDSFVSDSFLELDGSSTGGAHLGATGSTGVTASSVNAYADGTLGLKTNAANEVKMPVATGAAGTFLQTNGANPQQTIWDPLLVDNGTTLIYTGSGGLQAGPDGVHPGDVALVGNTTVVTPTPNTVNFLGPNVATFTAYGLQLSSTGPAAAGVMLVGSPTLGVSQVTYGTVPNSDLTNSSTTVNSQTCTLGSTCIIPIQTNTVSNTSQAGINLSTSTANTAGLTVTPVNSATNIEKFEITGTVTPAAGGNGSCTSTPCEFMIPGGFSTGYNTTATSNNPGANTLSCVDFYLPFSMTVNTLSVRVTTGIAASTTNMGIYSAAGAKLIDSGAIASATSSQTIPTAGASLAVSLNGGTVYSGCVSSSSALVIFAGLFNDAGTVLGNARYSSVFTATNTTSAGVMPATLGTRIVNNSNNIQFLLMTP